MRGHTTFTAIPSNVLKVEARASMSASFEVFAPPMKQLVPVAGQHIMQPQRLSKLLITRVSCPRLHNALPLTAAVPVAVQPLLVGFPAVQFICYFSRARLSEGASICPT
jgi:hypothetical protein